MLKKSKTTRLRSRIKNLPEIQGSVAATRARRAASVKSYVEEPEDEEEKEERERKRRKKEPEPQQSSSGRTYTRKNPDGKNPLISPVPLVIAPTTEDPAKAVQLAQLKQFTKTLLKKHGVKPKDAELAEKVLPLPKDDKENQTKRRVPPKKVPSYHLTGAKSMEYIKKADARTKEKEEKDKKTELVKKEAVKKLRLEERKAKQNK